MRLKDDDDSEPKSKEFKDAKISFIASWNVNLGKDSIAPLMGGTDTFDMLLRLNLKAHRDNADSRAVNVRARTFLQTPKFAYGL